MFGDIDDGSCLGLALGGIRSHLGVNEGPKLVAVDDWGP